MRLKFSNGERFFNVCTVGELKSVLNELDDELTVESSFGGSVDVVINYNENGEPHIEFEDGEDG